MNSTFPSVRDLPISEKRKEFIISHLIEEFYSTAIGRKAVTQKHVNSIDDLLHLGVNLIVDRIWFVDCVGEQTYAYQNIGFMEGKSIALSETEMIVKKILDETNVKENRLELKSEIDEASIETGISLLKGKGKTCTTIITNVHQVFSFWWFSKFKGALKSESPFGLEGYYSEIPVYWSNSVPDNITLLLNQNVGNFLIGKDISADIREIRNDEVESVLHNIPKMNRESIKEKVRLVADEFIRFDVRDKDASVSILSKKIEGATKNHPH